MATDYSKFTQGAPTGAAPVDRYEKYKAGNSESLSMTKSTEAGESWWEDPKMAARMVLDGVTFGWADEMGSHVAAAAVSILNPELTAGKSYSDIYNEIHGDVKAEEEEYREEHGTAATALNMAGGVMSPANFVMPGAAIAPGMGKATAMASRGALEGALYGAGSNEEDRLRGALSGGAMGATVGGAIGGVGWLWSKSGTRKVAQDLGKGSSFTPMTLAVDTADDVEAGLGEFYRDIVGSAWGGHQVIVGQEKRILDPIADKALKATRYLDDAKVNVKESVKKLKADVKTTNDLAKSRTTNVIDDLRRQGEDMKLSRNDIFEFEKTRVEAAKARELDESVKIANDRFRVKAITEAMPSGMPAGNADQILTAKTPNAALFKLDEMWQRHGFEMIKNRQFRINPQKVSESIASRLKDDPEFALSGGEGRRLLNDVTAFLTDRVRKGGWIDGEDLSALRSKVGMAAGAKSDAGGLGAVQQKMFFEMQDILNGEVEKQLSGKALTSFKQHQKAWKTNLLLRDSVTAASKKAGTDGAFTVDDWMRAIGKNSARDLRTGRGPLQQDASDLAKANTLAQGEIEKAADKALKAQAKLKAAGIRADRRVIADKIKAERAKLDKVKASGESRLVKAEAEFTAKNNIKQLEAEELQLTSMLDKLNNQAAGEGGSIFKKMVATGVAGSPVTAVLGTSFGLANILSGTALSRLFAKPSVQRFMAGQTGVQQNVINPVTKAMQTTIDPGFVGNKLVGGEDLGGIVGRVMSREASNRE